MRLFTQLTARPARASSLAARRLPVQRGGRAAAALALAALACGGGGLFGAPDPTLPAPQQWSQPTTASYSSPPVVADGVLVYEGPSSDLAQDVFGRDAATGGLL